jgi:DNA-binding Xre family transcriptional regulator
MNEHDEKLANVLLDSLMLDWRDNGNVSADAVRDSCIQALCEVLDVSFEEILAIVDRRIQEKQ